MKEITAEQVDDIIRLRYLGLVNSANHTAYATYNKLGKVFGISGSRIYHLIKTRFEEKHQEQLPFVQRLRLMRQKHERQRWGYRFLKTHEIEWITSSSTLRA